MKTLWKWLRPRRERFVANDGRISLPELDRAVRSVDASVRLVLPRLLRRVVRMHTSLPGSVFRVPHSKSYVISQKTLLEIADRNEIGFGPEEDLPELVILLERPGSEILDERPRGEILLTYWGLLYHARVHSKFYRLAAEGRFCHAVAEQRLAALGSLESDEIRNVLRQERFLLPPYDALSAYVEFVAVYLGIRYFQPCLMASFFPALESLEKVDALIALDIRAEELLEATRVPGTPEPEELREAARIAAEAFDADPLGMLPEFRDDAGVRGQARAGPAAGADRKRSTCGGRKVPHGRPCAATWRGPPFAAPGPSSGPRGSGLPRRPAPAGGCPRLRRAAASGLGHRGRGTATLARGPAGPGPSDAAGFVDGRGAVALRLAEGLRRPGADDFHGQRDALGSLAGPPADPPGTAQPATGA